VKGGDGREAVAADAAGDIAADLGEGEIVARQALVGIVWPAERVGDGLDAGDPKVASEVSPQAVVDGAGFGQLVPVEGGVA
jgi:hypothetical protein